MRAIVAGPAPGRASLGLVPFLDRGAPIDHAAQARPRLSGDSGGYFNRQEACHSSKDHSLDRLRRRSEDDARTVGGPLCRAQLRLPQLLPVGHQVFWHRVDLPAIPAVRKNSIGSQEKQLLVRTIKT
jgi:hypothetical protein